MRYGCVGAVTAALAGVDMTSPAITKPNTVLILDGTRCRMRMNLPIVASITLPEECFCRQVAFARGNGGDDAGSHGIWCEAGWHLRCKPNDGTSCNVTRAPRPVT